MVIFRNSIRNGTEFYYQWRKSHLDDILEGLHKLRIRESEGTQDRIGIVQYGDSSEERRTWLSQIEDNGDTEVSSKNLWITGILKPETEKLWKKRRGQESSGQNSVDKEFLEIVGSGKPTGSVSKGDNCSFRHDVNKCGKIDTAESVSELFSSQQNERNASRTRSPRGKSPSGRMSRWPCKDYTQRNLHQFILWESGTLQNACSTRPKSGCRFEGKMLLWASPGWRTA